MRLRGFSMGCQPMNGLIECVEQGIKDYFDKENEYHDILCYDRQLTDAEMYEYELDYIGIEMS